MKYKYTVENPDCGASTADDEHIVDVGVCISQFTQLEGDVVNSIISDCRSAIEQGRQHRNKTADDECFGRFPLLATAGRLVDVEKQYA